MKCKVCNSQINKEDKICPYCGNEIIHKEESFFKKQRRQKRKVYAVVLFIMLFACLMQAFNSYMEKFETPYGQYHESNCDKILKYDDGTISKPKEIYNEMIDHLSSLNYNVSSSFDIYYLKDSFTSDVYIQGEKEELSYIVYLSYDRGECVQKELSFNGSYEGELGNSLQYLNKEFNELSSILGYENVYDQFKKYYSSLEKHSENEGIQNCTIELDDYIIYIKENCGEDYNRTLYEYRVYNK